MTILFKKSDRLKSEKQREALNLFSKKKCIDSLDELLIMPLEKQKFEKLNAEGQKTRIKVFAKLTSLESMSLEKLRVITLYFRVFKTELDISSDKLKRLISILDDFLDTTKFSIYLETKYVFRSMVYVYPFHNNIGRLYSFGNSLQKMPRIFRRFLLGDIYVDVDIINAHPCILLEYAIQHSNFIVKL